MIITIVVLAVLFVLFVIFTGWKNDENISESDSKDFAGLLVKREVFLSGEEKEFFDLFDRYLKGRKWRLFPKVSLEHVVEIKDFYSPKAKEVYEKIKKLSVDFVIVDQEGKILRGVDFSHHHDAKLSPQEQIKQKLFVQLGLGYSKILKQDRYPFNEILEIQESSRASK